jgi:hypothetical protein
MCCGWLPLRHGNPLVHTSWSSRPTKRAIAEDTNLGLQTVRTIVDQGNGRDRTTVKHLQRIDPARFSEEPWRARTRAALLKRISVTLTQARALVQATKGLK